MLPNDLQIICGQYDQNKVLQREVTPPPGLQNNQRDTAAVSCVLKHESCSNGHRKSKQTGPSCRDRCSHSESGITENWSKRFTYCSTRRNHRSDKGSPMRPTAGDKLQRKSGTRFYTHNTIWEFVYSQRLEGKYNLFKYALTQAPISVLWNWLWLSVSQSWLRLATIYFHYRHIN